LTPSPPTPQRILILGGGFGGIYTALRLQKLLRRRPEVEVLLVSRENFLTFTPMLHEVAASDLELTHTVNPVRKLLRRVSFFLGDVERVDLAARRVTVSHGADAHTHDLAYDQLVLGLGAVTEFRGLPGVAEHALCMKSLGDAVALRNRLIQSLEEAASECAARAGLRETLLTFVVAGGGFAGVETLASLHDFARDALRFYPSLQAEQVRMILAHSGEVILPELDPRLGRYAERKLSGRGVEIRLGVRVQSYRDGCVKLSDGSEIRAHTLVWTAGTAPSPILAELPAKKEGGRVVTLDTLELPEWPGVFALGDCAWIPGPDGRPYPPTAQHALRQADVAARNLVAALDGRPKRRFAFKTIGQLATIGHRAGVARIFGLQFSGFPAWWLWRTIYLAKLPRAEKKLRVALDWALDLVFSRDIVQIR
jgi:NADH dehydrogenase